MGQSQFKSWQSKSLSIIATLSCAVLVFACQTTEVENVEFVSIDHSDVPLTFDPIIPMNQEEIQHRQLNYRNQLSQTIFVYSGATTESSTATAVIYVNEILDADVVFVDRPGDNDRLDRQIVSFHPDDIDVMGERGSSRGAEFQHFSLKSGRHCLGFIKYGGSDGAGDVAASATPLGSVMVFTEICDADSDTVSVSKRNNWIASVNYDG